jgi:hypothetical protein
LYLSVNKEGGAMSKKGVRATIISSQRRKIDIESMTQIVIALGREFAQRKRAKRERGGTSRAGAGP